MNMNKKITFDGNNPENIRSLMKEYGNSVSPYYGKNVDGEETEIHISHDNIIYKTYQNNGWVRVNEYNSNGLLESETFEGRWK